VERELARIAHKQHGVVTRAQLLSAGITVKRIRRRMEKGTLIAVHRGVYRVGHKAPSVEARYMAAVLGCGEGALLCGPAAAHLQGLLKGQPPAPEVIAPMQRKLRGVLTHHSRRMRPEEAATYRSIPITTVRRTLVDLASTLSLSALARACHEAGVKHGTTPAQVESLLKFRPNAPGAYNLRQILHGEVRVTLSELERRFLALLREAGLPLPVTNKFAGELRVDCRWPRHGLTVELDSYRFHRSRHAWEQDRRREREAHSRGDEHRRFTHDDVLDQPAPMLAELGKILPMHPRGGLRRGAPKPSERAR
jgi:hypothetical protein